MFGSRYSLNNNTPIVYEKKVVSIVSDFISDTVKVVDDFIDDTANAVKDFSEDPIGSLYEGQKQLLGVVDDFVDDTFDSIDNVVDAGIYLVKEALNGNTSAILNLATAVLSVYALWSIAGLVGTAEGGLAFAGGGWGGVAGRIVGTAVLVGAVAGIVSTLYSVYGIAISYNDIGKILSSGNTSAFFNELAKMKDRISLAFVNSWINGSIGMWMAGGQLYDAPKAGDVMFNPTGDLNATKFLGRENRNQNTQMMWEMGKYHDFQSKIFNNKAGNELFIVAPLVENK